MGLLKGDSTVEIDAPLDEVYAIAADLDTAAEWQGSLKDVDILERDDQGRATLVDTTNDAKVRTVQDAPDASRIRARPAWNGSR